VTIVSSANVEACSAYVHNIKAAQLESMLLARDPGLEYSALRLQFQLPIAWATGHYKLSVVLFLLLIVLFL
jgi:hypothetical protein